MSNFVEKRGLFVRNNPHKTLTYQAAKFTIYLKGLFLEKAEKETP